MESIEIPTGSSTDRISQILAEADVISDAGLFSRYVGLKGAGPWEAGNYTDFRVNSSFDEAIEVLDGGPLPVGATQVRITEGRRLVDALAQVAEQHPNVTDEDLLAALGSGEVTSKYLPEGTTNWEGLLFPDTYEFSDDATATEILQTLADEMSDTLDELGYDRAEALRGFSAYDVVKVASLAERETGQPEDERGKIARVIYNRLDNGEPLGIDASVLYGLGRDAGELTQSDLEADTPYNTRLNAGLPPTPIGLPSRAALEAAIEPPEGDWYYYVLVSNDPPTHLFTDSYSEFQDAKAQAQEDGVS
ncbi:MAG: endolytic transglycosylase MltG [Microthrixaceae bacterium]